MARFIRVTDAITEDAEQVVRKACSPNEKARDLWLHAEIFTDAPEGTHPLPPDALLRIFLWHTTVDKVPAPPVRPPAEDDVSERAWASLTALCHHRFIDKLRQNAVWRQRYTEAWPGLFKWCQYFFEQRVARNSQPDGGLYAHLVITELVHGLLYVPGLKAVVMSTPGIVKLAGQLWGYRHLPGDGHYAHMLTARITGMLLTVCTMDQLDGFCLAVTNGDDRTKPVAVLAMSRLKRTLRSPEELLQMQHALELYAHSIAIVVLARLPGHAATMSLLLENATWAMTSALVNVSRALDLRRGDTSMLSNCVNAGITFLRYALIREDSYRWVCQALDAGLLEAVASLCLLVEHRDLDSGPAGAHMRECLKHIMHDTLPKHMVYKSVVKVTRREMDEVPPRLVRERMNVSYVKDDWETIGNLVKLRATLAELEIQKKGVVSCDSLSCRKSGKKSQLKRCGGCQYVYYCSKECQATAWPNHKRMCQLKNEMNGHNKEPTMRMTFTESDAAFFRKLFGVDAHAHMPHLRRIAKRDFPTEPGENFVICVDYTDPEYPAGKCALKNIRTYTFGDLNSPAFDPANVAAQNQEMIAMVRRAPKEFTFIEAKFTLGERTLTRNVMIRPNLWAGADSELEHAMNWQHHDAQFACPNARHGLPSMLEGVIGDILDSGRDSDSESEWEDEEEEEEVSSPPPARVVDSMTRRFEALRMAEID
ncbi:hypothetical protein EXIGLDRAFT_725021 [Exidia glandulosa HHB12029]|uniref:MYND-type domain-containing protein n=1 Tax=Exidia glandulosa HHB12029 TaxID=1314781 RepID=A0A165E7Y0_EXIGL|nr:hypothetical protein EXIGLDRAFT_725021 [Exidia glandulosa HHB12029]